jgi:hypothetical protein
MNILYIVYFCLKKTIFNLCGSYEIMGWEGALAKGSFGISLKK